MRNLLILLCCILLFGLFLFGGSKYYTAANNAGYCGVPAKSLASHPWKVTDGIKSVVDKSDIFRFAQSSNVPIIPDVTNDGLKEVAGYLKSNADKNLTLTGLYESSENNKTQFGNLGMARAEAIKERLVQYGVGNSRILTKGESSSIDFDNGKELYGGVNFKFSKAVQAKPEPVKPAAITNVATLAISDGTRFSTKTDGNLTFNNSSYEFNKPLPADVKQSFREVTTYLKENPAKMLVLTGLYDKDEENTSILPNLGLARANNVKKAFTNLGVNSNQIDTKGLLNNNLKFNNKILTGGINYSFATKSETVDPRIAQIEKTLKIGPKYLYFETGKNRVVLDKELRSYFADLIYYMDRNPDSKVSIIGHTDDQGDAGANKRLGQKRADFINDYLRKNGISGKQTNTSSMGETSPIESNKTDEGRQKNRRVEVKPIIK